MLETNIDNMNGELYSYLYEKLLEAGALDVFTTPIFMKKNRSANMLSVLTEEKNETKIKNIIFEESTTLGIRRSRIERDELERKFKKVETIYGSIIIKAAVTPSGREKVHPEYEDVKKAADENGVSFMEVFNEAVKKYMDLK